MTIHFNCITPENWRTVNSLKVSEKQAKFVASNVTILARAFAYREYNSCVYAIYQDDCPIGLLMQHDLDQDGFVCVLDQFMIAEQYQRKGYGKAAMQLWLSVIKSQNKYKSIILCYVEGDDDAKNLYIGMGFQHNGDADGDEIVLEYKLINES